MVTGRTLLWAMMALGMASAVVNFLYYSSLSSMEVYSESGDEASLHFHKVLQADEQLHDLSHDDQEEHPSGRKPNKKKERKTFDGDFTGGQLIKKDRKGRTVVQAITSLKKENLGIGAADDDNPTPLTLEEASQGREPILDILREAGIHEFDAATVAKLPTWDQVEKLYGNGPAIYGLDTCETFRKTVPPEEASIASAGIFNSGTNTLAMYLNANCILPKNKNDKYGGMRWQPPWGRFTQ